MEKTAQVERKWWECDGCQYAMADVTETPAIEVRVPWDGEEVTREGSDTLVFHFHVHMSGTDRRDCFRYWAHNTHVMRRSLRDRGLDDDQIDEFMSVMLYRDEGRIGSSGIERPKSKTATG